MKYNVNTKELEGTPEEIRAFIGIPATKTKTEYYDVDSLMPKPKIQYKHTKHYTTHKFSRKNKRNHRRINAFARWDAGVDSELLNKKASGLTFSQIGKIIGRSADACSSRYFVLKNMSRS